MVSEFGVLVFWVFRGLGLLGLGIPFRLNPKPLFYLLEGDYN